jgi:hypothetical protein
MKRITVFILLMPLLVLSQQQLRQRKTGNPLDHLPANTRLLTHFGERADFSPDNLSIAFITKSFGDAMTVDINNGIIRCLTCNVPGAAFLRVMHLVTGDYILIGPDHFEDIHTSRSRDNELWFLSKKAGSKPVKFGQKMSEGMAISKKSLKIAFSQTSSQAGDLPGGASRLVVAELDLSGSTPKIINQNTVYESKDKDCTIEAQDFFDDDLQMTFVCYEPNGASSVMGIDLRTRKVINYSQHPGTYNECEGIFPGGKYTLVEADRQCDWLGGQRGASNIDIWKLKLDGKGNDFVRMTSFNDYTGGKASNPVVSTNGKYMAFQFANTSEPAGVGHGILLYTLKR